MAVSFYFKLCVGFSLISSIYI